MRFDRLRRGARRTDRLFAALACVGSVFLLGPAKIKFACIFFTSEKKAVTLKPLFDK